MPKIGTPISENITPERHLVAFQVQSPIGGELVCDATFRHRKVLDDGTVIEQHDESVTLNQATILTMSDAANIITTIKTFLHAAKDAAESGK